MLSGAAPSPSAHQSTTDARPGGARSREGVSLKVDGRERAHVWHMCNGIGARKAHACACSDPATHRDCVHDTTCCARPATGPSACPGCPRMSVCAKRVAKACKHDTSTSTSAFTVHARLTDLRAYGVGLLTAEVKTRDHLPLAGRSCVDLSRSHRVRLAAARALIPLRRAEAVVRVLDGGKRLPPSLRRRRVRPSVRPWSSAHVA